MTIRVTVIVLPGVGAPVPPDNNAASSDIHEFEFYDHKDVIAPRQMVELAAGRAWAKLVELRPDLQNLEFYTT